MIETARPFGGRPTDLGAFRVASSRAPTKVGARLSFDGPWSFEGRPSRDPDLGLVIGAWGDCP